MENYLRKSVGDVLEAFSRYLHGKEPTEVPSMDSARWEPFASADWNQVDLDCLNGYADIIIFLKPAGFWWLLSKVLTLIARMGRETERGREIEESPFVLGVLTFPMDRPDFNFLFDERTGLPIITERHITALIELVRCIRRSDFVNLPDDYDLRLFYDETVDLLMFLGECREKIRTLKTRFD